jgi:hypothetical protein
VVRARRSQRLLPKRTDEHRHVRTPSAHVPPAAGGLEAFCILESGIWNGKGVGARPYPGFASRAIVRTSRRRVLASRHPSGFVREIDAEFERTLVSTKTSSSRRSSGIRSTRPDCLRRCHGYAEFLQVIAGPHLEEHRSTLRWAGGQFDPEALNAAAVKFDDPKKRWKKAFER